MLNYLLSRNAFVCESEKHVVFLDLKRDRYLALTPDDAAILRIILKGSDATSEVRAGVENSRRQEGRVNELTKVLEREGLIVRDHARGKELEFLVLEEPMSASRSEERVWARLQWSHFRNFLAAWASAAFMLQLFPLHMTVRRVMARKAKGVAKGAGDLSGDAQAITRVFCLLQPMFLSVENSCLIKSLTLIEFLARYDRFPTWVFGVRIQPFTAHCWVQEGTIVLNDDVQHVRSFTPLMSI